MIRTIIVEDEKHCMDRLCDLLHHYFSGSIQVLSCFTTVEESVHFISGNKLDLVFLDVQLGEESGFDLLQCIEQKDFEVIFTTAYERYAVQAFRFSAIDYLLKPVDLTDLEMAVKKMENKVTAGDLSRKYEVLLHNLNSLNGPMKKISIPTLDGLQFVQISDIVRCAADINYTTIYLKDGHKIIVSRTLKEFEELLEPYNFFRVHQSHLINLAYIKSYNKGKGGFVSLTDKSVVEVATRRKEEFLKRIAEL